MSIIRPRVWTQQPHVPVRVSSDVPSNASLFVADPSGIDVVSNNIPTIARTRAYPSITPIGKSFRIVDSGTGANFYYGTHSAQRMSGATESTTIIVFRTNNTSYSPHLYGSWNCPTNHWLLQLSTTGMVWVACEDSSAYRRRWDASGLFTQGKIHNLVLVWRGGAVAEMYLDGIDRSASLVANHNGTALAIRANPPLIHLGQYPSGSQCDVDVVLSYVSPKAINKSFALDVSRNPWQIFRPRVT